MDPRGPGPIFHVDMDAFFAAVEVRDDPRLRGKPVLVGGAGRRGVVAAASYEARRFGCRSAQPMVEALRRCPDAIVRPPRRGAYVEASHQVFGVFRHYSPLVEALSIDEAFLDMGGSERLLGPPVVAAAALKAEVVAATGLTCSVGIASVKFLAKIASAVNKPDGITEIPPGDEIAFLDPLPISKLWGVGAKGERTLRDAGVRTVGDIRRLSESRLVQWFGEHGRHLARLARGIDDRAVVPGREAKSISHEDTYAEDIGDPDELRRRLLGQAARVADRLVAGGIAGRRVQLKIRDGTFKTETRQLTLEHPTQDTRVIYAAVRELLGQVDLRGRAFRLTGVGVGALQPAGVQAQLSLLPTGDETRRQRGEDLQQIVSAVRERYGRDALYAAEAGRAGTSATGSITHRPADDD